MARKNVVFIIDSDRDLDGAWQELVSSGCEILYSLEAEGEQHLVGHLPTGIEPGTFIETHPFVLSVAEDKLGAIDWEAQWAEHGHGYKEGFLHIDLGEGRNKEGPHLRLKPGPGFGDLSHPTTRLVMLMMAPYVKRAVVVDVGCGSGILSVAAAALGAVAVYGIDIDEEAVEHSRINAALNGMEEAIIFTSKPRALAKALGERPFIALMNMIESEQVQAWSSLKSIHSGAHHLITSGILKEQEEEYIKYFYKMGWRLIDRQEEEGWVAFVFIPNVY